MASNAISLSGRSSTRRMLTRSSPVADAPPESTAARGSAAAFISRHLAVDPLRQLLVVRLVGSEARRLLHPQPEEAEPDEALVEEPVHAVLQRAVEVDEHVPADYQVEIVERSVGGQIVLREDDVPPQ